MNRRVCLGLMVALGAATLAPLETAAQTVTLRMVGSWAPGFSPSADVGHKFKDLVNQHGAGKVAIRYIGAEDVVPPFDQPEALVNGVFDVWYGAPNYWAGVVPGGDITELSPFLAPDGGPGSALHQFMVKLYERRGVRFLGHAAGDLGVGTHYITTRKRVARIEDLKGMKIRVAPVTRHFVQAAGAESITLPPAEIFLAMDRGTVDGFSWPVADAFTRYGWQNVSKFLIDQPMYRSGVSIVVNQRAWSRLSKEAQDVLMRAVAETQTWTRGWFAENLDKQKAAMRAAGMEIVTLSEADRDRWTKVANEALWKYYEGVMPKDVFAEAATLLERNR
ncbi:TRAP transporter substrate-binding protein [Rhodoplanes serenus]|uniref:TRAP transporter substrate-binding protein n=1 Tax=Rhodoplanes serenus TaxID=200615 RepID=UPI0011B94641|nr:TRAP transporter substrate-binding protein DctP [Rhodoplanes serenus]